MTLPNVPQAEGMSPEVRRYLDAVKREIKATIVDLNALVIPSKATEAQAEAGSDDTNFLTSLTAVAAVKTHSPFVNFAYFEDQKATNTVGGSGAPSATYNTRTLNTEVYNGITGCSLSTNEVTLPAGTYLIEASCPAFRIEKHKCRLYNVTAAAAIAYGTSEHAANNTASAQPSGQSRSWVTTRLTLASSAAIRLEHAIGNAGTTQDWGVPMNLTGVEVYSVLKVWKLDSWAFSTHYLEKQHQMRPIVPLR